MSETGKPGLAGACFAREHDRDAIVAGEKRYFLEHFSKDAALGGGEGPMRCCDRAV